MTQPTCTRSRSGSRPSATRSAICRSRWSPSITLSWPATSRATISGTEDLCRKLMQRSTASGPVSSSASRCFPPSFAVPSWPRTLAERGVFDEGDAHGQEAIRMAEALDRPYSIIWHVWGSRLWTTSGGTAPGRPAARTRGRAVPREDHHGLDSARDGVAGCTCTRGRDASRRACPAAAGPDRLRIHGDQILPLAQRRAARRGVPVADQVEDARACADRAVSARP